MMRTLSPQRWLRINGTLFLITTLTLLLATAVGPESLSKDILLVSRVPRVLLAAVAGLALGSSGCAFQGLLQNSLADPYILGVSSGAALGSILGVVAGLPYQAIPLLAFACALAATLLVYTTASTRRQVFPHTLLLTGVILNAFLFAVILLLNGLVSFEHSQKVLTILIGNLEAESFGRIGLAAVLVFAGLVVLIAEGYPLNLLSAGPESATSLGLNVGRHRKRIFFAASLMVGAVVPLTGLIGFIGLFVPHITRRLFGPDHRVSIPASAWIGAILLVLCDTVARTILVSSAYQSELPVGAITALVGAPFFLTLLKRGSR